ncbi:uncharacterized protein DDB_G0271670 [Anopheles nili]|uniref:uncharacterized protein DDB_G0271670 n=1 Tax=Anopheles nili TaxID=185578 RepID=UPI00237A14D7|nr:uncharacterized protein DDB_G0271670 [Anopheles nili]
MDVDSPNALKRCSSAPHINNLLPTSTVGVQPMEQVQSQPEPSTSRGSIQHHHQHHHGHQVLLPGGHTEPLHTGPSMLNSSSSHQGSASSVSRELLPTSFSNIFTPRVRRFSASFSPLAVISNGSASPSRNGCGTPGPRLTPRISQLRQEECADVSNSREVNHEREIHTAMQMSQSCEDLTLVAENWSFSGTASKMLCDDLQNPLHVALPTIGSTCCSSPSPTSRGGIGLQYPTTSPSPTRKFVTRRSMSPCPLRPSPLSSSVKRKFDLEDNYGNCYSPPSKKIFTSERGSSPVCQTPSPSPICPSPDSSTASFENGSNNNGNGSNTPICGPFPLVASSSGSGRITPKFFLSKLTGPQSPGATVCSMAPLGMGIVGGGLSGVHFGGSSTPSSTCSTPTGTTNPMGMIGGGDTGRGYSLTTAGNAAMMMDCGVSSSSSSSECRDPTIMEVSHSGMYEERPMEGTMTLVEIHTPPPPKEANTSSIKEACDETEASNSDNQHQVGRLMRPSPALNVARELREQILKSALDADTTGNCNSNSSSSSSSSSSISSSSGSSSSSSSSSGSSSVSNNSTSSNSCCTTSDNNTSANDDNGSMSSLAASSNALDSSSSTSTGNPVSVANAATPICPPLTSFPMMAIPSNLTEIAES